MHFVTVIVFCAVTNVQSINAYQGILINGVSGTQLYDPFNTPHTQGNLTLGLPQGLSAYGGGAVINGNLAYFASGGQGECTFSDQKHWNILRICRF